MTQETKPTKAMPAAAHVDNENSNKRKMLEVTFAQIDKQHGKGLVMFLGDSKQENIPAISSGSILIDDAIGVGGYPVGRIALHAIAQAQRKGGICAYIDAEHALDTQYATQLGININDLIISQPDYGEQALDIAEMLVRSGSVDIVVIDSVAALVPKAELEGDMGDVHMGLQARLMSQALRKLTPIIHKSKTVLIFINQIRHNISSMPFANKETTTGGNALKFYASLRLDVRKIASLKKDDRHFGNRVAVKIVKNKVAAPFKRVELDVIFGKGISYELDLLDAALHYQVIAQSGSWFAHDQKKFAQGREQALSYIEENTDFAAQVHEEIRQAQAKAKLL